MQGVPTHWSEDELAQHTLTDAATRFHKLDNDGKLYTLNIVLLQYSGDPPEYVKIGYGQYKTHVYISRQSKLCYKLGPTSKNCRSMGLVCEEIT